MKNIEMIGALCTALMVAREKETSNWAMMIYLKGQFEAPEGWDEVAGQAALICDEYLRLANEGIWATCHDVAFTTRTHFSYEKWVTLEKGFWYHGRLVVVPRAIMDLVHAGLVEGTYLPSETYAPALEELRGSIDSGHWAGHAAVYRSHGIDADLADQWAIAAEAYREHLISMSGARTLAGAWQWGATENVAYPKELQLPWNER